MAGHRGFTLVEIMIVVAIIGLLASIAIPNFVRARSTSQRNSCISNLRQLDWAKQQWALEMRVAVGATPLASDLQSYLGRGAAGSIATVTCPADPLSTVATSYDINPLDTAPACKIVPLSHVFN